MGNVHLFLQYQADGAGSVTAFLVVILFWVGLFVALLALDRVLDAFV